jgi:hypothetical protein
VVIIEMGEGNHFKMIAVRSFEIGAQFSREINSAISRIILAAHGGIVE